MFSFFRKHPPAVDLRTAPFVDLLRQRATALAKQRKMPSSEIEEFAKIPEACAWLIAHHFISSAWSVKLVEQSGSRAIEFTDWITRILMAACLGAKLAEDGLSFSMDTAMSMQPALVHGLPPAAVRAAREMALDWMSSTPSTVAIPKFAELCMHSSVNYVRTGDQALVTQFAPMYALVVDFIAKQVTVVGVGPLGRRPAAGE